MHAVMHDDNSHVNGCEWDDGEFVVAGASYPCITAANSAAACLACTLWVLHAASRNC